MHENVEGVFQTQGGNDKPYRYIRNRQIGEKTQNRRCRDNEQKRWKVNGVKKEMMPRPLSVLGAYSMNGPGSQRKC